jgi:predicted esterase
LLLFHGLGDSEAPFATFARNLALPGVLAISVRGIAPLPALVAPEGGSAGFHWGDDLRFDEGEGALDPDPGFERARGWVMDRLIGEVLVGKCGWELEDVMLFGFGQGGAFALGLASALRAGPRVEEVAGGNTGPGMRGGKKFKGVVSVGGGLPASMMPTVSGLGKAQTPVLVCCGRESEAVDEDAVDLLEREFERVKVVRWKRADDGMPLNREEVLPMMEFFAERLRSGWL